MTDRILQILDNVRYWETCPEDYKKDIETFLEAQNQALRIHDVVGRSEQFKCHSCGTNHSGKNDDQLFEVCKTCFDGI